MLSVAEEPREVFAIGLVKARAGACAVIHREPVADGGLEAADEGAGTGGILEREAPIAAGAGDGDGRTRLEPWREARYNRREIDV
ncbi:MAG TPA: hypothetical protein VGJ96_07205 [Gemmatimonadaceae bacterium]